MSEMERIAALLGRLTEADSACPTADAFSIPSSKEIKDKAMKDVTEGDFESRTSAVRIHVAAKKPLGEPFDKWGSSDWDKNCPKLGEELAKSILPHINALGSDEVGSLETTKGSGPGASVSEAPVEADFSDAEYIEIEDVDEEKDSRVTLVLRFDVPLSYGRYRHAYP